MRAGTSGSHSQTVKREEHPVEKWMGKRMGECEIPEEMLFLAFWLPLIFFSWPVLTEQLILATSWCQQEAAANTSAAMEIRGHGDI